MSEPNTPAPGPRVGVYALIGQNDRLLLIGYPGHDALPGGPVRAGEPVEQALRRSLLDQLGATIAELDFCVAVEHGPSEAGEPSASEVAFLFDVTLTNPDLLNDAAQPHRWADEHDLSALHPQAVRDELIAGTLSAERPWRAWTP
ncbi:NUDIX domain-containing protein [Prauserella sp. PE36]|uniref:8-oxo-dGTP diphosphatase n=1 Tax=Amycolatopsis marina TaxID=490629 RepID=A0A1I1BGD7_9PSEU|nr:MULTISPECIES: NUDIX domain-containing protein [Pseudonocardiaceae]RBM18682.1 NUDIX domain-containing protein [Prauserella sp. PE36]SFB49425.1 8-oxo-dGTP diphosphatase [Amycolatopsis marina]